jgi:L-serine/L-threonine ammonia-lyase
LVARDIVNGSTGSLYVPPFDHQLIWDGNSSIITELALTNNIHAPDAVVLSVGGGGLLTGVKIGLQKMGWLKT